MKIIIKLFLAIIMAVFSTISFVYWDCSYTWSEDFTSQLSDCLNDSALVWAWNTDFTVTWGFKDQVNKWTTNIAVFLWIFAVLWIVYWSFTMVISAWEDEKLNKSKNTIKWSIIWFIAIILASTVVNVVVKLMYTIW